MTTRTFEDTQAKRDKVPLLVGLVGPSGGGKTGSALELAHGIQDIVGGEIFYLDTEAKRALHYADAPVFSNPSRRFAFRHVPFVAPFGPMDYLGAIDYCASKGARTIVVDSMSHEHEGPGGVLEMHDAEVTRLAGDDWQKRERVKMLAWQKPKIERRKLINTLLQYNINFIFCFRAKEKLKMVRGKEPEPQGWQPIAGEEFVFEMTLNCLLPPGANGIPEWSPDEKAERLMIKLPQQFREILTNGRPLSVEVGRELARWAVGGGGTKAPDRPTVSTPWSLYVEFLKKHDASLTDEQKSVIRTMAPRGSAPDLIDMAKAKVLEFVEANKPKPDPAEEQPAPEVSGEESHQPGLGIF